MISFVLCQSPIFFADFRSGGYRLYRFWKMRSWSLRPPYCRFGVPSWTVAKPRVCCCVPVAAGATALERIWAEAFVGVAVRDNILKLVVARLSGFKVRISSETLWQVDGDVKDVERDNCPGKLPNRPMILITKLKHRIEGRALSIAAKPKRICVSAVLPGVATN